MHLVNKSVRISARLSNKLYCFIATFMNPLFLSVFLFFIREFSLSCYIYIRDEELGLRLGKIIVNDSNHFKLLFFVFRRERFVEI